MEPGEKISFGFSKLTKKPTLLPNNKRTEEKKLELIDCLEGQSIRIKDAVEVIDEPLVIPLKENKKNLIDRIKEIRAKQTVKIIDAVEDHRPDSELTLDQLAERELLREAKERLVKPTETTKVTLLPQNPDTLPLEGEKEPTLQDYEKIPINDFGLAMLRGMGWKEGEGIGKNPTKVDLSAAPDMRPKGLGLGANRMVKNETPPLDKSGKALILQKGVFAKIIAGSHKGQYGEVLGLDDEASRVILKTGLKSEILTLNEFLVLPVPKEEYTKYSKCLNHTTFTEYKQKEKQEQHPQKSKSSKNHDSSSKSSSSEKEKHERVHKRKDKRRHRDKSRSPRRRSGGYYKKSSSNRRNRSSSDSSSDYEEKKKHRNSRKSKK